MYGKDGLCVIMAHGDGDCGPEKRVLARIIEILAEQHGHKLTVAVEYHIFVG
jgi:hypothetical protein